MVKTPTVPTLSDPQFLDYALNELSTYLTDKLTWLDKAYGKIDTQIEGKGRTKSKYPAIYVGSKNNLGYLKLLPDSHIGNFSYVQVLKHEIADRDVQIYDVALVFWFNFVKVYPTDHKTKTVENVKKTIYDLLKNNGFSSFRIRLGEFVEGADKIYNGFDHKEIQNQFLMRPYGGFRLNAKIRVGKNCN